MYCKAPFFDIVPSAPNLKRILPPIRANDPALTLIAASRLLSQLASRVAACLFDRQLQAYLRELPVSLRKRVWPILKQIASACTPVERLILLKKIKKNGNGRGRRQ